VIKQEKSDDNGANADRGAINVEQKSAGLFIQCLADEHKIRSNHAIWTND